MDDANAQRNCALRQSCFRSNGNFALLIQWMHDLSEKSSIFRDHALVAFMPSAPPPFISHFASLTGEYDVVLSDVWGVVHNGVAATSPACDALTRSGAAEERQWLLEVRHVCLRTLIAARR